MFFVLTEPAAVLGFDRQKVGENNMAETWFSNLREKKQIMFDRNVILQLAREETNSSFWKRDAYKPPVTLLFMNNRSNMKIVDRALFYSSKNAVRTNSFG